MGMILVLTEDFEPVCTFEMTKGEFLKDHYLSDEYKAFYEVVNYKIDPRENRVTEVTTFNKQTIILKGSK